MLTAPVSLLAINKWVYKNLPYDPDRDFVPITNAGSVPNMLIVHPSVPAGNVAELITYAKANPGKINFASMGTGTTGHLSGELFKLMANVDMVHVPYKGSAPALADLLGGQVQIMFDNMPTAIKLAQSGKVKGLALTSLKENALAPGVPTLDEAGLKGFSVTAWFGFVAPKGTPQPSRRETERRDRQGAARSESLREPVATGCDDHRRRAERLCRLHGSRVEQVARGGREIRRTGELTGDVRPRIMGGMARDSKAGDPAAQSARAAISSAHSPRDSRSCAPSAMARAS